MADPPPTPPGPRPDPSGDEGTTRHDPRWDTLDATNAADFRHGRFEPGQRLGSRYRIVALLGQGGMGEVYRADDLELGQSVALKFLPERVASDESWLRRFRNEVRTARQVAHPNLCRIYDIGQEDGHVFLSMEYIDGEDLAGVLRRLGRPSRQKSIEIARQLCLGLAAAHENNVLHRDLKPANIMIDGRGRVRITDFGLAGFLDEFEHVDARAGTPAYMAPEQLADGQVSVRTDIYALGLIFYEVFTGQCVFDTNDIGELKRRHSSGSVTTPSALSDEIDPAVERVIMRCLEARPEQRPQSVYQVLAALPGGDPLAAALAAGETPSPELVANARDAGGLSPRVAIGLLLVMLVSLAYKTFENANSVVMPPISPSELSVVAKQIMGELGYDDLPGNSISGFGVNTKLSQAVRSTPRPYDEVAEGEWPPRFRYWRRWSRGSFITRDFHAPERFAIDGPTTGEAGTATVALDSAGRLIGLVVEADLSSSASSAAIEVDWSSVLGRAGLDDAVAQNVPLHKPPPVYCDEAIAWRLERADFAGDAITVQMGAVGGRPSYFEIVGLDEQMAVPFEAGTPPFVVVIVVILLILAWRNLLAARGDMRNAVRCALLIGGLYLLLEVLSLRVGGPNAGAQVGNLVVGRAAGHIVLHAMTICLIYLAFEPYVRRVWPRMLIGLIRVLSGRLRDPAVGREVLIGVAVGCGLFAILGLASYVRYQLLADGAGHLPQWMSLEAMISPASFLSTKVHGAATTVVVTSTLVGLLIAIRLLTRHARATFVLGVIAIGSIGCFSITKFGEQPTSVGIIYGISFGVATVFLYTRVGVLSGIVAFLTVMRPGLLTPDLDAWYAPYGLAEAAILLVLAGYGFWVSLAGQPIFKHVVAEPHPAAS
ncbi:MAG: serine/threonine protein kinase [Planctomycetes bacterium]|nr:serine/threonine protein kinase [Planctomycetota bacterium]